MENNGTLNACKNPNCKCELGTVCKHGGPFTGAKTLPYDVEPTPTGLRGNTYQDLANRTAARVPITLSGFESDLLNWTTGLTGEAGEVADLIKKGIFHGQGIDEDKLRRELGDVLWYVAAFCYSYGFSLEDVMLENIEKLRKRFPDGFSAERSTFREDVDKNNS